MVVVYRYGAAGLFLKRDPSKITAESSNVGPEKYKSQALVKESYVQITLLQSGSIGKTKDIFVVAMRGIST